MGKGGLEYSTWLNPYNRILEFLIDTCAEYKSFVLPKCVDDAVGRDCLLDFLKALVTRLNVNEEDVEKGELEKAIHFSLKPFESDIFLAAFSDE